MHSYTPSDVASDDFDLSTLAVPPDETKVIQAKISATRTDLEAKKKATLQSGGYCWVSDVEVLDACTFLTDSYYLSMVFSDQFLRDVSRAITTNRDSSWYILCGLTTWLTHNSELAKRALLSSTTNGDIKSAIVNNSLVQVEDLIESVQSKLALHFPSGIQERLLEMSDPEDARVFISSDYDRVRLLAYQKIGPLSHLDEMIKDPHALLRKYAVRLLSPGDQRLASFINDRSQDVFIQALSKISVSLIPMMLGSSHLKKKRAKEVLKQRLQS